MEHSLFLLKQWKARSLITTQSKTCVPLTLLSTGQELLATVDSLTSMHALTPFVMETMRNLTASDKPAYQEELLHMLLEV